MTLKFALLTLSLCLLLPAGRLKAAETIVNFSVATNGMGAVRVALRDGDRVVVGLESGVVGKTGSSVGLALWKMVEVGKGGSNGPAVLELRQTGRVVTSSNIVAELALTCRRVADAYPITLLVQVPFRPSYDPAPGEAETQARFQVPREAGRGEELRIIRVPLGESRQEMQSVLIYISQDLSLLTAVVPVKRWGFPKVEAEYFYVLP